MILLIVVAEAVDPALHALLQGWLDDECRSIIVRIKALYDRHLYLTPVLLVLGLSLHNEQRIGSI